MIFIAIKQGVLNIFSQILVVQFHKNKHMNQFHIHGLYNLFYC
jgi:hypothetical protein